MNELTVSIGDFGGVTSGAYDDNGVQWTWTDITGWFDGPPARTSFTARPHYDGAFGSPVYNDARVIKAGLNIAVDREADRPALETVRAAAQAVLCRGGQETLVVNGRGMTLQAAVYRSDTTTCDPDGETAYNVEFQFTAVDPIRYAPASAGPRAGCDLAAPAASGLDFAAGKNLLSNPDFESGLAPWTATGGTAVQSTDHPYGGSYSAKLTPDGTSFLVYLESEKVPVTANTPVAMSARVWVSEPLTSTTDFSLSVQWFDSAGTATSTNIYYPPTMPVGEWVNVVVQGGYTPGTGEVFAAIRPTLSNTPSPSQVIYVDYASVDYPGGLDFSNGGLDFGGGAQATLMYLTNAGTADVLPVFTFTKPVSQPVLTNADNGGRLEYLGDVAAGQSLVIDCKTKRVLLSGVSRRNSMGRCDFEAFKIPAGGTLRVSFGSLTYPTAGAHVDATWQDGYW